MIFRKFIRFCLIEVFLLFKIVQFFPFKNIFTYNHNKLIIQLYLKYYLL